MNTKEISLKKHLLKTQDQGHGEADKRENNERLIDVENDLFLRSLLI